MIHLGSCNTHDIPTIVENKFVKSATTVGITDYNGIVMCISVFICIYLYLSVYHNIYI